MGPAPYATRARAKSPKGMKGQNGGQNGDSEGSSRRDTKGSPSASPSSQSARSHRLPAAVQTVQARCQVVHGASRTACPVACLAPDQAGASAPIGRSAAALRLAGCFSARSSPGSPSLQHLCCSTHPPALPACDAVGRHCQRRWIWAWHLGWCLQAVTRTASWTRGVRVGSEQQRPPASGVPASGVRRRWAVRSITHITFVASQRSNGERTGAELSAELAVPGVIREALLVVPGAGGLQPTLLCAVAGANDPEAMRLWTGSCASCWSQYICGWAALAGAEQMD
jgi:hypothetical protein